MDEKSIDDLERRVVVVQIIVERLVPSELYNFETPFKSVQEWLYFLCANEQRSEPVSEYMITLHKWPYLLVSLVGYHHGKEQGIEATRIVFKPKQYMWIKLPRKIYKRLDNEQFINQVHAELRALFSTEQFKNSFLAQAYTISTNFEKDIWPLV
jgi:hypothetical protein